LFLGRLAEAVMGSLAGRRCTNLGSWFVFCALFHPEHSSRRDFLWFCTSKKAYLSVCVFFCSQLCYFMLWGDRKYWLRFRYAVYGSVCGGHKQENGWKLECKVAFPRRSNCNPSCWPEFRNEVLIHVVKISIIQILFSLIYDRQIVHQSRNK